MTGLEIAILIIGILLVTGSFFMTKKLSETDVLELQKMSKAEIKTILDKELTESDKKIKEKLDESLDKAFEDLERKTDKETNDKIKEISEYSDTVLTSMNKSHDEIMFMYDMLNKKQETITTLTEKIDNMESVLRQIKEEVELKEKIVIEEKERLESEKEARDDKEFESLKEELKKKIDSDIENTEAAGTNPDQRTNVNEEILKLAGEGYSEIDIAKKLGLGIGEIKLVLGLFKNN